MVCLPRVGANAGLPISPAGLIDADGTVALFALVVPTHGARYRGIPVDFPQCLQYGFGLATFRSFDGGSYHMGCVVGVMASVRWNDIDGGG